MELLVWLSCLTFGTDVSALGDRDYYVRSSAHKRLQAAGLFAVPALTHGLKTANPEARMRSEMLISATPTIEQRFAYAAGQMVVHDKTVSDDVLRMVASLMKQSPVIADEVYRQLDATKRFQSPDCRRWVEQRPYANKTLEGDMVYCMQYIRAKLVRYPRPDGSDAN